MTLLLNIAHNIINEENSKPFLKLAKRPKDGGYVPEKKDADKYWKARTVDITQNPVVRFVVDYLKKNYNLNVICQEASIQSWLEGSESEIHNHKDIWDANINVLIYLNEDYEGGEFYMPDYNIKLKPKTGMMVCFDGNKINHGVTKVKKGDRFSLIFWCKEV